jgi:hypothetical protein
MRQSKLVKCIAASDELGCLAAVDDANFAFSYRTATQLVAVFVAFDTLTRCTAFVVVNEVTFFVFDFVVGLHHFIDVADIALMRQLLLSHQALLVVSAAAFVATFFLLQAALYTLLARRGLWAVECRHAVVGGLLPGATG